MKNSTRTKTGCVFSSSNIANLPLFEVARTFFGRFWLARSPPHEGDEGYDAIKFSFRITLRAGYRMVGF